MMTLNPKVTILMPVHNGDAFLRESINSILSQTFSDFEFLIIDDGSIDETSKILESYNDFRIKIIKQENIGLAKSLNKGLKLARGEYIARMDCDDVSLPERLEKQVELMERYPYVGVCGSWIKTIGDDGGDIWRYPALSEDIRCRLLFESVIAHPSVMIRNSLFKKFNLTYDEDFNQAQDYDLWARCSHLFPMVNLDKVLLHYRIHPHQGGVQHLGSKRRLANLIRKKQLERLEIVPDKREVKIHESLSCYHFETNEDFVMGANSWLLKLYNKNRELLYYDSEAFERLLARKWYLVCEMASGLGIVIWKIFCQSPLSKAVNISFIKRLKLFTKCTIKYRTSQL